MNAKSIFITAGALIVGSAVGWFTGRPAPALAPVVTSLPPAQSVPDIAAAQGVTAPPKTRFAVLYDHLAWLETASAAEVAQYLWATSVHDAARRALNKRYFMRFSARERLNALLSIDAGTHHSWIGDEADWLTPTIVAMIVEAPDDVARLLTAAQVGSETAGILDGLFAKQGYDGCLAFISKLPEKEQDRLRGAAATLLAKKDLARAQAESLKVPEGSARNEMVEAVTKVWAETDPRAALAWAVQHGRELLNGHDGLGGNPAGSLLSALFSKDPKLGGELLLENQGVFGGFYGANKLSQTFESWAARDYQAAADWLAANPLNDRLRDSATQAVFSTRLKSLKGAEAIRFYENLPDDLKGECGRALLTAVGVDGLPGGLLGFSQSLPENERLSFLVRIGHGQVDLTTEQIKAIVPMVAKLDTDGHTTRDFLRKLPEADLVAFQSMLPAGVQAEVSIQAAEKAMDAGDWETAQALLSKTEGAKQTLPHAQLAISMAQDQPDNAVAWINSLPDGAAKTDAITNLAANWAKTDQAAAAAWVEKLPPGKARDEALTEIALLQGLGGDTAAAFALAASVQSDTARLEAFAHAARTEWFRDAAGAEALLAAQGLTAEQTQKVIAKIQAGRTR